MICAGIDAGSRSIKAVLYDTCRPGILASGLIDQGVEQERLATELFERLLRDAGLERAQISGIVATGYGRNAIGFADSTVTEITCHARGVHHLVPDARTIIEIGGQDSKVISLEEGGRVRDFAMNDRCAAGTGRFLEMVAGPGNAPAGRGGRGAKRHCHARLRTGWTHNGASGLFHRGRRAATRHGQGAGRGFVMPRYNRAQSAIHRRTGGRAFRATGGESGVWLVNYFCRLVRRGVFSS